MAYNRKIKVAQKWKVGSTWLAKKGFLFTAQPLLESVGRHGDMVLSDPPITDKKRNREQLSLISTVDIYFFGSVEVVECGCPPLAARKVADAVKQRPRALLRRVVPWSTAANPNG